MRRLVPDGSARQRRPLVQNEPGYREPPAAQQPSGVPAARAVGAAPG